MSEETICVTKDEKYMVYYCLSFIKGIIDFTKNNTIESDELFNNLLKKFHDEEYLEKLKGLE